MRIEVTVYPLENMFDFSVTYNFTGLHCEERMNPIFERNALLMAIDPYVKGLFY